MPPGIEASHWGLIPSSTGKEPSLDPIHPSSPSEGETPGRYPSLPVIPFMVATLMAMV